jgi:hypothetical protein
MLRHIRVAAPIAAAILLIALTANGSSGAASYQQVAMNWHAQSGTGPVGDGALARLYRSEDGVSFQIQARSLKPGNAYTVWFVVVNNPGACDPSPCTAPDIIHNPATSGQVVWGGGGVAGANGTLGFGGGFTTGEIHKGWIRARGLTNPMGAEIHLVINDHGPVIASQMPAMLLTYRAGCTDASLPAVFPPSAKADGAPGPNTCRLYQTAVFQ